MHAYNNNNSCSDNLQDVLTTWEAEKEHAYINVDLTSVTGPSNLTLTAVRIHFIQATAMTNEIVYVPWHV